MVFAIAICATAKQFFKMSILCVLEKLLVAVKTSITSLENSSDYAASKIQTYTKICGMVEKWRQIQFCYG
jgi:hypothetical protein